MVHLSYPSISFAKYRVYSGGDQIPHHPIILEVIHAITNEETRWSPHVIYSELLIGSDRPHDFEMRGPGAPLTRADPSFALYYEPLIG